MNKTAIFIYEEGQVPFLKNMLSVFSEAEKKDSIVIALGLNVEYALKAQNILFDSGRGLRTVSHEESLDYAEKIGREILDDPTFSFLSYRDVNLVDVFVPVFQLYVIYMLYALDVMTTLAQKYPEYKNLVVLPPSQFVFETGGILAELENTGMTDAARLVGEKVGFTIIAPKAERRSASLLKRIDTAWFYFQRRLFGWFLFVLNTLIALFVPQKKIRVLASEYWKNISSLIGTLPEVEIVLLDRAESRKAGLRSISQHRMQFIHVENYLSRAQYKVASQQVDSFLKQWRKVEENNVPLTQAQFRGHALKPLLLVALQRLVTVGGVRAVRAIDGTYAAYKRVRPDIVMVRAGASGQIHFAILCYVARALKIPSIELQHGLLPLGQNSFFKRRAAEYAATYGSLTSKEFEERAGYKQEKLFSIGSPRFDVYKTMREKDATRPVQGKPFTFGCIVPAILPHSWSDSYEVVEYLQSLASAAARVPNSLCILKLRPDPDNEVFYRRVIAEAFGKVPYRIAQYESLVDVIAESDVVVTIYSTTVLEGLISGRPTVFNGTLAMHAAFGEDLRHYIPDEILHVVHTQEELTRSFELLARDPGHRKELVGKADRFMEQNFSFDGKASQKMADVVRKLAKKQEM
ncbi:CDP-glycerol glycerophosphotransferase family protein [Acetobacteraceae bacterium]|nr:CDP-glycerol glycerophosphotransferase family protein [Candidatus Parcubacteria bacterium]